jgi:hypothetical protein
MINKKVKDERGQEYILLQFIVHEGKVKGVIETADGKFWTEEIHKLRLVKD